MNREEFMRELTYLLQDVQDDERDEALKYYSDYFDEAGEENEDSVVEELESPEKVAAIIKDGLMEDRKNEGEFSEKGFEDERFARKNEMTKRPDYMQNREQDPRYGHYTGNGGYAYQSGNAAGQTPPKKESSGWKVAAIVLLCLFAIPIGIPLLLAAAAVLFSLLVTAAAILFTMIVLCVVFLVVGIFMIGVGIAKMFSFAALGVLVCGVGFLFVAFGILGSILTGFLLVKGIPACCRGISFIWRRLFGGRRKGYAA